MNFLAEILNSAEQQSIQSINQRLPTVQSNVSLCQHKVLEFLKDVYVTFLERPKQNKLLSKKTSELHEEVTQLKNDLEEVVKKNVDEVRQEVIKDLEILQTTKVAMAFVKSIYDMHETFLRIKELQADGHYLECIRELQRTDGALEVLCQTNDSPVLNAFSKKVHEKQLVIEGIVTMEFKEHVLLKKEQSFSEMEIVHGNDLVDIIQTLYELSPSVPSLGAVTKFLWTNVFVPIVDCTTSVQTTDDVSAKLRIEILDAKIKLPYNVVFSNIRTTVEFLTKYWSFVISEEEDLTTLKYLGRDIADNLSELIIKRCLQDTIPSDEEGLKDFSVVIAATKELEKLLIDATIFRPDVGSILEYASNIDILFINKKCSQYLSMAEALMKKDLHSLVEVGTDTNQNVFEANSGMARCSISKGLVELTDLLQNILDESLQKSELCAGRLLCTVEKICQQYAVFVPKHHKKFLQTIPQQVAVFHNNCHYLANKLTEWHDANFAKVPASLKPVLVGFNKQAESVQLVANDMFSNYVDDQVKQIQNILKESHLDAVKTLETVDDAVEKCLRQCLRQQELLKTVWMKVLSYSVYNRTLGVILHSLCDQLINYTVQFEDIASDAAQKLADLLKMVQTRGPKLFTDPNEVGLFVTSWYRLGEVIFVLNARLLDINDRWADGKGPLALQFKPEELRKLIRALFQNTERRAALLDKIHS